MIASWFTVKLTFVLLQYADEQSQQDTPPDTGTTTQVMARNFRSNLELHVHTGVGTRGPGGQGAPIFYPRDFINIHTCSADRRDRKVYYVRPPQNGIASYAYV